MYSSSTGPPASTELAKTQYLSICGTAVSLPLTGYLQPSPGGFLRKCGLCRTYCVSLSASLHPLQLLARNNKSRNTEPEAYQQLLNSKHPNAICIADSTIQVRKKFFYRNSVLSSRYYSKTDAHSARIILDLAYLTE